MKKESVENVGLTERLFHANGNQVPNNYYEHRAVERNLTDDVFPAA